jgi:hypothetical protein
MNYETRNEKNTEKGLKDTVVRTARRNAVTVKKTNVK